MAGRDVSSSQSRRSVCERVVSPGLARDLLLGRETSSMERGFVLFALREACGYGMNWLRMRMILGMKNGCKT